MVVLKAAQALALCAAVLACSRAVAGGSASYALGEGGARAGLFARATVQERVDGEYGLSVRFSGDSMVVQWLTQDSAIGLLRATPNGRAALRFVTAAGRAHRVAFRLPRNSDEVMLRYGALTDSATTDTRVSTGTPRRPPVSAGRADSLYVIGDTHGEFNALLAGLHTAGLIDSGLHWKGGRKQLVFAGDLTDRGPEVTRLLWFVYGLEAEAARAGGAVHVVLGNHETMVMLNDVRYVHPREHALARAHNLPYYRLFDPRTSVLGRWLVSKPGMIRIGPVLIAHGGITPEYAKLGLRAFDDTLAAYTAEDFFYNFGDTTAVIRVDSATYSARDRFFWGPRSVFWHREYIATDTATADLADVLKRLDATTLVIGHTAVPTIVARYNDRVIAAHTPRYGSELLLLVRDGERYRRFRLATGRDPQEF